MPNAAQHTIKYKREGDYSKEIAHVVPVEYQNGLNPDWCCEKCVYGSGQHSKWCKKEQLELKFE